MACQCCRRRATAQRGWPRVRRRRLAGGRRSPATGATSHRSLDNDDALIYRKRFELAPAPEGRRHFVTLDGVFYQADVWLDGAYLGDPEGYFFPHSFDITGLSRLATEHVLAVEVACPAQRNTKAKRTITGVFQNWDAMDPTWNPGGLWRPVRIETTGPVRIDRCRVLCRDVNDSRAHLRLHARLDSDIGPDGAGHHACRWAAARSARAVAGRRAQRGRLEPRHQRSAAVVAVVAR